MSRKVWGRLEAKLNHGLLSSYGPELKDSAAQNLAIPTLIVDSRIFVSKCTKDRCERDAGICSAKLLVQAFADPAMD